MHPIDLARLGDGLTAAAIVAGAVIVFAVLFTAIALAAMAALGIDPADSDGEAGE